MKHESNYLLNRRNIMLGIKAPEVKEPKGAIAKQSEKQKQKIKDAKPDKEKQLQWFKERVAQFTGKCSECGGSTNKKNFQFAMMACAHILPKRSNMFPSVATHPDNWIELCVTNGCHHKYDRSWEDAMTMKIWPLVVEKFKLIYPSIAPGERKHLPDVLRQEVL